MDYALMFLLSTTGIAVIWQTWDLVSLRRDQKHLLKQVGTLCDYVVVLDKNLRSLTDANTSLRITFIQAMEDQHQWLISILNGQQPRKPTLTVVRNEEGK